MAGSIAALIVDAIYLGAIRQQGGGGPGWRVAFVAAWILACSVLGLFGALGHSPVRIRASLMATSASGLFALGVPAIFSAGVPLLLCSALVGAGAIATARELPVSRPAQLLAGFLFLVAAIGLLLLGFALTDV